MRESERDKKEFDQTNNAGRELEADFTIKECLAPALDLFEPQLTLEDIEVEQRAVTELFYKFLQAERAVRLEQFKELDAVPDKAYETVEYLRAFPEPQAFLFFELGTLPNAAMIAAEKMRKRIVNISDEKLMSIGVRKSIGLRGISYELNCYREAYGELLQPTVEYYLGRGVALHLESGSLVKAQRYIEFIGLRGEIPRRIQSLFPDYITTLMLHENISTYSELGDWLKKQISIISGNSHFGTDTNDDTRVLEKVLEPFDHSSEIANSLNEAWCEFEEKVRGEQERIEKRKVKENEQRRAYDAQQRALLYQRHRDMGRDR